MSAWGSVPSVARSAASAALAPADTATTAVRIVTVTQAFTADQPIPTRQTVATVTMTRENGRWAVTDDGQHGCGVVTR